MTKEAASSREYEKGVDRWKHVGTTDHPEIVHHNGIPKYAIGKCPRNVPDATKAELLQEAVPANNGDREIDYPKRLLVVHEGAVYRAETTTAGKSYHAYPYSGKHGKLMLRELQAMADRKGCRREFDKWVDKHIKVHGK